VRAKLIERFFNFAWPDVERRRKLRDFRRLGGHE